MMTIFHLFISLFFLLPDAGITFYQGTVEDVIDQAKRDNKLIFVDTYAVWCKPCKQMDEVFRDKAVGNLFNEHFISLKVDMDGPLGKSVSEQYDVVWLPTLLILDQEGNLTSKIDRLVSAQELMQIALGVLNAASAPSVDSKLYSTPFETSSSHQETERPLVTEEDAPVLYVYDERASSGRPHIMFHEAYLHLQLMDGKHQKVVKKYLSTQEDWSTEKNVRFIFDFVGDTRSPQFTYLMANKHRFYEVLGRKKVDETIRILVDQRLNYGVPRPDLQESIDLYGYVYPEQATQLAYKYHLSRLLENNERKPFLSMADRYLREVNPYDHLMAYRYINDRLQGGYTLQELEDFSRWMQTASSLVPDNAHYALLAAQIYYLRSEKALALKECERSLGLAAVQGKDTSEIEELKFRIAQL